MDLEKMLDQRHDPAIRRDLEALAQSNPEAAEALSLQDRIDASLARLALAPSADILTARLRQAAPAALQQARRNNFMRQMRSLAAAAVLMLAAVGYWWWNRPPTIPPGEPPTVVAAYERETAVGFKPYEICRDPSAYRETFERRLGQGLIATALPSVVEPLGWSYGAAVTGNSIYLMANVKKEPVLVIFDRLSADHPQPTGKGNLHVYRREIDQLVLYEVSPLDKSYIIDEFLKPPAP